MVDPLVGVKTHLLGRLLVGGLLVLGEVLVLLAAGGVVAQHDPFVLDRDELALVAAPADRRLLDAVRALHEVRVGVALVGVDVGGDLVLGGRLFELEERVQHRDVLVHPFGDPFLFVEISVNVFAVAQQIVKAFLLQLLDGEFDGADGLAHLFAGPGFQTVLERHQLGLVRRDDRLLVLFELAQVLVVAAVQRHGVGVRVELERGHPEKREG